MMLAENFSLAEFTSKRQEEISEVEYLMLQNMAQNILQPLRDFLSHELGEDCPLRITSGMRSESDYNRLRAAGYHPSETSDHYFGAAVPLASEAKRKIFGSHYCSSVGAADIVPACGADRAWLLLRPRMIQFYPAFNLPGVCVKIGQCIYEQGDHSGWIHISNPANLIYTESYSTNFLSRKCFLASYDNGATYNSVF